MSCAPLIILGALWGHCQSEAPKYTSDQYDHHLHWIDTAEKTRKRWLSVELNPLPASDKYICVISHNLNTPTVISIEKNTYWIQDANRLKLSSVYYEIGKFALPVRQQFTVQWMTNKIKLQGSGRCRVIYVGRKMKQQYLVRQMRNRKT